MLAQSSTLDTLWPLGAAELSLVFGRILQGTDPSALDLVYIPSDDPSAVERFWTNATSWQPFDVDAITGMGPHDRGWAETVLVSRLVHGDLDAAKAMVALEVPRWAAHLEAAISVIGDRSPP
jgi:hypothetical protein